MTKTYQMSSLIIISVLLLTPSVYAEEYESSERINLVAENFIKNQLKNENPDSIKIAVNPSNIRFEVAHCDTDITPSNTDNSASTYMKAIQLNCMGRNQWKIIVPVTVSLMSNVLVAKYNIPTHEAINENNVEFAKAEINKLYDGYYTDKNQILGYNAAHLILAGTIITKKNVKEPLLVIRNQPVTIVSKSGSISVSMKGIARDDGAINSLVKIYNPNSKRIVEATVTGPNLAVVNT